MRDALNGWMKKFLAPRRIPGTLEGKERPLPRRDKNIDQPASSAKLPDGNTVDVTLIYAIASLLVGFNLTAIMLFFLFRFGAEMSGPLSVKVAVGMAAALAFGLMIFIRRKRLSHIFAGGGVSALVAGALPSAFPNLTLSYEKNGEKWAFSFGFIDQALSLALGAAVAAVLIAIAIKVAQTE